MIVEAIRSEAARIDDACELIENTIATQPLTAEAWRLALGIVEGANRRVYQLRKTMLDEALRRNREHQTD